MVHHSQTVLVKHNDKVIEDEVYFATCISNMYLLLNTCRNMGLIHKDFPHNNVKDITDTSVNVIADHNDHLIDQNECHFQPQRNL